MKTCKAASLLSILTLHSLYSTCFASQADIQLDSMWNNATNRQTERRLQDCRILQSSATPTQEYRSGTPAKGIFFTFRTAQDADLLSIEFGIYPENPNQTIPVQVYYKEDTFDGATGNVQAWTPLADTSARLAPDNKTAIVPVLNFAKTAITANTLYALYVSLQTADVLFTKGSSAPAGELGTVLSNADDGNLQRLKGFMTLDGPFPESLAKNAEIAEFAGVIHYTSTQSCNTILQTTKVDLQFAINAVPVAENLNELAGSYIDALNSIFVRNTTLAEAKREYLIDYNEGVANFMGTSDLCPSTYEFCATVITSVDVEHLPKLTSGQLRRLILGEAEYMAGTVTNQSSFVVDLIYIGGREESLLTALSFEGVPSEMDDTQKHYFELTYTEFLQGLITDIEIHEVLITDQSQSRRRALRGVEDLDDQRELQSTTVKSTMLVYGIGGTVDQLRTSVFDAVNANKDDLIRSLKLEGLRPGFLVQEPDVNVDPAFFTGLQGIRVAVPGTGSSGGGGGSSGTGGTDGAASESSESSVWLIVSGVGIGLSVLFLIYRSYMDFCYQEKYQVTKLDRGDSYGASESNSRSVRPQLDGVVEDPDAEEIEVVAKPDLIEGPPQPGLEREDSSPPEERVSSRSLDPSSRTNQEAPPPEQQSSDGEQNRGRSFSPKRRLQGKRPQSQERLRPRSQEGLRSRSKEGFAKAKDGLKQLVRPQSQERMRSRSQEGLRNNPNRSYDNHDPAGAAQRYLQERNKMMAAQSAHNPRQRSRSREGLRKKNQGLSRSEHSPLRQPQKKHPMLTQSAHDPRMHGTKGEGPKAITGDAGLSSDEESSSGSEAFNRPNFADYERDSFANDSNRPSFTDDSVPPPPATSPPVASSPARPSPSAKAKAKSPKAKPKSPKVRGKSPKAKPKSHPSTGVVAKYKNGQMALYSPEDGTGVKLVEIVQMQAFKGKNNIACYKIRLQGSNVEKTMVKETFLMDLNDAPAAGATPVANPLIQFPRKKSSNVSVSSSSTPGKKKKMKKVPSGASVASGGVMSPKKKKKKKPGASRSLSPTRKKKNPGMKKKTNSSEDLAKKGPTRGVRRSSSWDPKAIGAAASANQHETFKLPRRKQSLERNAIAKNATPPGDDDSVESALDSNEMGAPSGGIKRSSKEVGKQTESAKSKASANPDSSSEESDLDESEQHA